MNKFILFFLLLSSFFSFANEFNFEDFNKSIYEVEIPSTINEINLGDIIYKLEGEKLIAINTENLKAKLKIIAKNKLIQRVHSSQKWTKIEAVPFKISYDPKNVMVNWDIAIEDLVAKKMDGGQNLELEYAGQLSPPAPVSLGVSLDGETKRGDSYFGGDYNSLYYNSFFNFKGFVFENRGFYEHDLENDLDPIWVHQDKSLTKDIIASSVRLQLGDTRSKNFGFLTSYQIGGLNIQKNFSLRPYKKSIPQGEDEFQVFSRSRVLTYVNGSLVKDEFLPAGNYKFENLPLINGINQIRVEITDSFGEKRTLEYNIPTSISLLGRGETNFSLSIGKPYSDNNNVRDYDDKNLHSGFFQYGVSSNLTGGGYFQEFVDYSLVGTSLGGATSFGNLFLEFAASNDDKVSGHASALTYQVQHQGKVYFNGISSLFRYENYNEEFYNTYSNQGNPLKESFDINLSAPLGHKLSLSLGTGIATFQDQDLGERRKYNFSGNFRVSKSINLNFHTSKVESTDSDDILTASFFFTWNIDQKNQYMTYNRDAQNNENRLTYTFDNNNRILKPKFNLALEEREDENERVLDSSVTLPTSMADFSYRYAHANSENQKFKLSSYRVSTALIAGMGDGFGFALTRNQNNSFVIMTKDESLSDQDLALKSSSPYADANDPYIGDLALSGLVPYQFREIQIDSKELELGSSLEKEKFVIKPSYKSIHVLKAKLKSLKSLKGKLKYMGNDFKLGLGKANGQIFFTDREGNFYIEGIKGTILEIQIKNRTKRIKLPNKKTGVIDMGAIEL